MRSRLARIPRTAWWAALWGCLAALMAGALVYTSTGFTGAVLCFLAWCGGVVSATTARRIYDAHYPQNGPQPRG